MASQNTLTPAQASVLSLLSYSLLRNARPARAATLLEALDLLEPGNPRTLRALVFAQLGAGKPKTALRTLDRLAMAGAADALFHLLRAQVLITLERPIEASLAMKTFVQLRATGAPAPKPGN